MSETLEEWADRMHAETGDGGLVRCNPLQAQAMEGARSRAQAKKDASEARKERLWAAMLALAPRSADYYNTTDGYEPELVGAGELRLRAEALVKAWEEAE